MGLQNLPEAHAVRRATRHRRRSGLVSGLRVASTAVHAVLIAKAASLPAWMQLLHPVACHRQEQASVLPAYPAAWPQAKRRHPLVQRMFQVHCDVTSMGLIRKAGYRYRQTALASDAAADDLRRAASRVGLDHVLSSLSGLNMRRRGSAEPHARLRAAWSSDFSRHLSSARSSAAMPRAIQVRRSKAPSG